MTTATHTPGYVKMRKWDADGEALICFGMPDPDGLPNTWRAANWMPFPSEADAREFVRRWNAHEALLAACRLWDEGFIDGEKFDLDQFLRWVNANRRAAREAIAKAT
jgi:hypothetical protein